MKLDLKLSQLSEATKLVIFVIFLLSLSGRQLLSLLSLFVGHNINSHLIFSVLGFGAICLVFSLIKNFSRLSLLSLIVALLIAVCLYQTLFIEELSHLILFGLLGFFLMRDLTPINSFSKSIILTMGLGTLIAVLDELLQALLPWRFGTLLDVAVGSASLLVGILAYQICYNSKAGI